MIQRQHLSRTLYHLQSPISSSSPCRRCTCRCGLSLQPSISLHKPPQHQQSRPYARRAPSTIDRSRAREARPITPTQAAAIKSRKDFNDGWFLREVQFHTRAGGLLQCSPESVPLFLSDFSFESDKSRGQSFLEPKVFLPLLGKYLYGFATAEVISRILLRDDLPGNIYMGKKLLYSISKAGYVESTIRILAQAYMQARDKPGVLKSREIAFAREHLTKVAKSPRGENYRAMVLEGKIALLLEDEEYAIEMLNKAMDAAVEDSEIQLASVEGQNREVRADTLELTAPWHELMQLHYYRSTAKGLNEIHLCEAAMEIGCQQDDPLSHKFKADYVKRWEKHDAENDEVVHIGTSDWLHDITKAASSGVPQAAYELGVFYAESGWKYIEDEPPDHIKPTPFDSYPSAQQVIKTFWTDLLHLSGLKNRSITPQERTFHNAIFPHTAVDRLKMAIGWLEEAMGYNYAAAYLMMARLHNRKTLWAQADAPIEALKLDDKRYTYSSKQNFLQGNPISSIPPAEKEDPPNPLYSPLKAQSYLREVFDAYEAWRYESQMKIKYANARTNGSMGKFVNNDDALDVHSMIENGGLPTRLQKWFKFPEVRELNGEKIKGLWEEAKAICEEEEWMLVDEEGGLVYKSGLGERKLTNVDD